MSVNIGEPGTPPMLFYADPEQLMNHLIETNGLDAVTGMAEVAAWCEAPARAIGRSDVRQPPKTLDEMFACAENEQEREAIRTALFGSVMDVVDRYLPDRERHAMLRGMLAFLSVNSTYRGPYSPGSAMCLAFALTAPGTQMIRKVRGGIGALCAHLQAMLEAHGGEVRLHAKVDEIRHRRRAGHRRAPRRRRGDRRADRGVEPRPDAHVHQADGPGRRPRRGCASASSASTTAPRTCRSTSRSTVCPSSSTSTR